MSIPETLQIKLREGRVIPFVGAGVSMSVLDKETDEPLFPSWRELLERAANRLELEANIEHANAVRALLAVKRDYLEVAELAKEGLGEAVWYKFLREQFVYSRERVKPGSLRLAEAIWRLNSQLIITTNYDDVLRWASPYDPVLWDREAPAEMAAFLQHETKQHTIWHLHGRIHNVSKIILTRDGYKLLYPEATDEDAQTYYKSALKTLHSTLASYTFLFIGFSLNDAYFGMQLEGINGAYEHSTGPHYVLMHEEEQVRGKALVAGVKVIPFEDFNESLLRLINELGDIANSKEQEPILPKRQDVPTPVADYNPSKYVFSVPFRQKGDQVIGREEALQAVRKQLTEGRRTAIGQTAAFQGLGGLGKTQLAVEYAYRFEDSYPNGVIWLNADQDIDAQLTELADKAGWIAPASEHKYKLDVARRRLRTYSDCLIIFDNLENPETIEDYLPEPQANPHILVTSRLPQPDFIAVPLDSLNKDDSFNLLVQEANREPVGDEEESAAREIAVTLGGLPLALELAGAYLRNLPISWQKYRDLLSRNLKAALPGKLGGSFTRHEADLYSTLKINEELIEEEPKIKEILDLLTWSGTAPMGESLICALLNVEDPTELTRAFGLGISLRLLQKTSDADSYSIHRLVGEVRRAEIPLQERPDWVDIICQRIGDWFEGRREEFSELFHFEAEIDHLQAWQKNAEQYAPKHSSRLIWLQAYPSYHRGQYQEIKNLVEKALELFEAQLDGDLKLKAHLFNDLAFSYGALGDYERDLEYADKALKIRLELFGERHPDTARSILNLGVLYGHLGDYNRNLEYVKKALDIYLELFGERHPDTARSIYNVGSVYGHLGDYNRNLEYVKKALDIYLELFGEQHSDVARSFGNIGYVYGRLGNHRQGLEYSKKALEVYLELFGERHPETAHSFSSVGRAYGFLGNYSRELEYTERALKIRLELFGERHPDVARSFLDISSAYDHLAKRELNLEYTKKALEVYLELFGERHPDTANAFGYVSAAYGKLGDYEQSIKYEEKALELNREILGDKHPDTIWSVGNFVQLLINLNRRPEAFQLLKEFLGQLPKDHVHYDWLKKIEQNLLSTPIRKGFRQAPIKRQERKHKKKKKKG